MVEIHRIIIIMPGHDHSLHDNYAYGVLKSKKQLLNWICPVEDSSIGIDACLSRYFRKDYSFFFLYYFVEY